MDANYAFDFPDPHCLELEALPADQDGLGHTNNTVYVRWCEQVAWNHSERLGIDLALYQELDRAMAIIRSEFDYLNPSRAGDAVIAATWISGWDGRLSLWRRFQVLRAGDGVTLLRARMRFACIQISSGQPRRLPRRFIDGYGPAARAIEDR